MFLQSGELGLSDSIVFKGKIAKKYINVAFYAPK